MDKDKLISISNEAGIIFNTTDNDSLIASHKLLHSKLVNPQSYSVIFGETSSGKSTIINGLFSKKILPVSAKPTTGAVTQLIIDNNSKEQIFKAINKNATIEVLEKDIFEHLTIKPDENLLRLQTILPHPVGKYDGLNIFDTPGYNSLVSEHEEVLRNFVPESDIIIHVIGYRMGFGDQDQLLLDSISQEIDQQDIPVLLVVNRCPNGVTKSSKRIKEIKDHAEDTLHKEVELIIVPSIIQEDLSTPIDVLPRAEELWSSLFNIANSEKRINQLFENGRGNLLILLKELRLDLEEEVMLYNLNDKELEFLKQQLGEFIGTKEKLYTILESYAKRWNNTIPKLLEHSISNLIKSTSEIIEDNNKWLDFNACKAYLSGHHLPYNIRKINKEVNDYFRVELEAMNKEMEDLSNLALTKLSKSADYESSTSYSEILQVLVSKIWSRLIANTSKNILEGLGGIGGVGAGTGNLVKMGVKRFGNFFGKTFSRGVYDGIGRTFTKKFVEKLNFALMVAIEVGKYIYESKTWQKKLNKQIVKSFSEFKEEAKTEIISETIKEIKKSNIDTINEIFFELENDTTEEIYKIKNDETYLQLESKKEKIKLIKKLELKLSI